MSTLLEILQNQMKEKQQPGPDLGQGAQMQELLSTKITGKESTTGGTIPKRSMQGELAAQGAAQAELGQIEKQADFGQEQQVQQAADQAAQGQLADTERASRLDAKRQEFMQKSEDIINLYSRENKKLKTDREVATIGHAIDMMRLSNNKYIKELQDKGRRARLDDETQFKIAYYEQEFKDMEDLFRTKLDAKVLMNADDRAFEQELAKISIEDAIALANSEIANANKLGMFQGATQIVSGGLQATGKYLDSKEADAAAKAQAALAEKRHQETIAALKGGQ